MYKIINYVFEVQFMVMIKSCRGVGCMLTRIRVEERRCLLWGEFDGIKHNFNGRGGGFYI